MSNDKVVELTSAELVDWRPELDTPVWDRFPEATAANAQEVYPGVGDPLSFDVNLMAIDNGQRGFTRKIGLAGVMGLDAWPHVAYFPSYYGHVFINISATRELVKWIPQGDPDAIDEQLFGATRAAGEPRFKTTLRQRLVRIRTLVKLIPMLRGLPKALAANNRQVETYMRALQAADLSRYPDAQLMRELDVAIRRNEFTAELHIANTLLSGSGFENLRKFLVTENVPDVGATIADLCTGLEDVESAKPGRALARLSAQIRGDDRLRPLFTSGDETSVLEALRASDEPAARAIRAQFDEFLRTYGYRGVRELGLTTRVWAMRPESVIGLLQSYVNRDEGLDPDATLREQVHRREQETAQVEGQLGRGKRRKFRGLLKAAHAGIAGRELSKSQWVRSTHSVRLTVREIGHRLDERGFIPSVEAVYFLRLAEVKELMAGKQLLNVAERITSRQSDYRRCLDIETDERFVGRPVPRLRKAATTEPSARDGTVLKGLPVSPGRVTARARVIKELTDEVELQPGEILVCPFTDAAWTPLFFSAAAVVMDLGGPLSHGSTVAREYGIPAVVNVKIGTSTIRQGQMVTVDGSTGEVTLGAAL